MSDRRFIQINKAIGRHAKFFFIGAEHWPAVIVSLAIAILIGQVFGIGDWTLQVLIFCGCFGTWVIAAGKNPKRFLAKFASPPHWKRGRILYTHPFTKRKAHFDD